MTFDVTQDNHIDTRAGWKLFYEIFSTCRKCHNSTIFIISLKNIGMEDYYLNNGILNYRESINDNFNYESFVSLKDMTALEPPEYLPKNIDNIFREGAVCMSVKCFNAAGTMFRLCIDLATLSMLPEDNGVGLNHKTRRDLGLRLPWLFDNGKLPEGLRELSLCIKDDGNDGAHAGTLTYEEAEDLLDFTYAMLERIYTEPERLRIAKERREARHIKK